MQSVNPQEKRIKIDGLNVSYKQVGSGSIPIVLLHGWGINSNKYSVTVDKLSKENTDFKIIIPDLPGFGQSDEPEEDWSLDNYVEFVDKFINGVTREKKVFELIKNILNDLSLSRGLAPVITGAKPLRFVTLIGHSFGGRIAIKYAVKYPEKIDKLILTGAAGIKHKLTFKQRMFYILAKTGKKIFSIFSETKFPVGNLVSYSRKFLYKLAREKDYYQASLRMKEVMKNVLAEDLTPILEKIKTPTLLVWGKLDNSTPLADGELMNEKIENSELVIVDDANHSLPYQKPEEFVEIILKFINSSDFK